MLLMDAKPAACKHIIHLCLSCADHPPTQHLSSLRDMWVEISAVDNAILKLAQLEGIERQTVNSSKKWIGIL